MKKVFWLTALFVATYYNITGFILAYGYYAEWKILEPGSMIHDLHPVFFSHIFFAVCAYFASAYFFEATSENPQIKLYEFIGKSLRYCLILFFIILIPLGIAAGAWAMFVLFYLLVALFLAIAASLVVYCLILIDIYFLKEHRKFIIGLILFLALLMAVSIVLGGYRTYSNVKRELSLRLSSDEAFQIARQSKECSDIGAITDRFIYNSGTWIIQIKRESEPEGFRREGENCPACVIDERKGSVEVMWGCSSGCKYNDTKMCPDGSYVERGGPACKFLPCSASDPEGEKPSWLYLSWVDTGCNKKSDFIIESTFGGYWKSLVIVAELITGKTLYDIDPQKPMCP